jgi:hypothetical protein
MAETRVTVAGRPVVLDPAGALWIEDSRTLVVADLHLEKSSSFARRGMMLPPYDTGATLSLLSALLARREPTTVICLGDSFHDRFGFERLAADNRSRLAGLQRGREWIWVTGNHDRVLPDQIGGTVLDEMETGGLTFRHEPIPGCRDGEVAGHLHPAARIRGPGRSVRCRAFATDGLRMILPALGVLAGGLNVLDCAFAPLFSGTTLRAVLIGGERLFPVAFSSLSPD